MVDTFAMWWDRGHSCMIPGWSWLRLPVRLCESGTGAGIRFGGDTDVFSPVYGANHRYGLNNVLRGNNVRANSGHGYKFMWGSQDAECSNVGTGNGAVK